MLGVSGRHVPPIKVYESLTGWTAKALRKRNISLHLRQPLLARFDRPECLFIGFTAGLGASPVLAKLGWQVMPWSQIAYVGSIIENSTVDCESGSPRGWHVHGLTPYDGPPIRSFGDSKHDWGSHCYFWISNAEVALALDRQLAAITGGDVCRWRGIWGQVVESVLWTGLGPHRSRWIGRGQGTGRRMGPYLSRCIGQVDGSGWVVVKSWRT